ncbi:hypothetical protein GFC01_03320 [Desulfofundulus thermobenzoicus]|uniref:Uncharacterized protein n=1 Tax=Desulfofundulus thermobenzoicus TaxID=29376 RepID=A0A6N7INY8_9FIRM|nr:hypothetical protein [Desulfofundulus thermobenzoicus]MQL51307.1 hypothetical protein [Desulfofundulus thermobenzoicus]
MKNLIVLLVMVVTLTFTSIVSANEIKVTIPTGSAGNQIEYIEQTGAGQLLGPECFNPKPNGGFNILDTAKNRVISINSEGKQDGIHEFDQNIITPVKIATDQNNNLYLVDPGKGIIGKLHNSNLLFFKIQRLSLDTLIDFGVNDHGFPFVVLANESGGISYVFELINNVAKINNIIEGRLTPDGKVYKTTLIKEKGYDVGHACKISFFDINNKLTKEILIKSNHWIGGARYLGEVNGDLVIQTHEFELDANYNTHFEDLVKKVSVDGTIKAIAVLPRKCKYVSNDTVLANSAVYHLNTGINEVKIEEVNFTPIDHYKSALDQFSRVEANEILADSTTTDKNSLVITQSLPTVNRSLIQSTAQSYWSWTWYCSQSNYNTTGGSIRPRYITAPNQNYQSVPYCWGGSDSLASFQSRQGSGWTCGNINTDGYYISGTCGVDCSGYVQRCLGLNDKKYDTTMLDSSNISFRVSPSSLKFGDAWNKSDHIMLYHQRDGYGNYILYEATKLNAYDRVAHTVRNASEVESAYHAIRRQNINEDV